MIEVDLPDGSVAEFPDGTPRETIKSAIQKRFPPQQAAPFRKGDASASFLQGATLGFGDEITAGGAAALRTIYDPRTNQWFSGDFGNKYDQGLAEERQLLADTRAKHPIASTALEIGGGVAGSMLPVGGALAGAQTLGGAALRGMGAGAALGAAQGFGQGEGGLGNRAAGAAIGGAAGGAIGAAAPYAAAGLGRVARPFVTSPERAAMAQILEREGVQTTAGQRTGNNSLRYAESELGGQRAQDIMERQGEQFTAAAMRRVGSTANRAGAPELDDAFTRIGQRMDQLAANNHLIPDQQLVNDLHAVRQQYDAIVNQSQRAPIVGNTVDDIMHTISLNGPNGTPAIQGKSIQALNSRLARLARTNKDPQLTEALRGLRQSLANGMERSIARTNPRDLGAWREANNQYRNLIAVEQAATGAGENAALGLISPSQLRNATVSKHGRRNYARGRGDLAELARAGEALMKPLPNSGTAGRTAARALGMGIPAAIGGGYGYGSNGPEGALVGAVAGAALPRIAGRVLLSGPVQRYLSRQAGGAAYNGRLAAGLLGSGVTTSGLLSGPR